MINLINLRSDTFQTIKIELYTKLLFAIGGYISCLSCDDTHDDEKQKMTTFIRILLVFFLEDNNSMSCETREQNYWWFILFFTFISLQLIKYNLKAV